MTNHTAAQPLDLAALDKLEELACAYECQNDRWYNEFELADGVTYKPAVKFILTVSPSVVLALIAQARAAQPESATLASQEDITGTTGASVKTWQERYTEACQGPAEPGFRWHYMLEEIADLRAQLARQSQGVNALELFSELRDAVTECINYERNSKNWSAADAKDAAKGELRIMPVEPTPEMVRAMKDAWWAGTSAHVMKTTDAYRVYLAAMAAAPSSEKGGDAVGGENG